MPYITSIHEEGQISRDLCCNQKNIQDPVTTSIMSVDLKDYMKLYKERVMWGWPADGRDFIPSVSMIYHKFTMA